jgi:hypothetical protein
MHDTLLLIFTGILAVAVVTQSFLFFGIYRCIRQLTLQMDELGKDLLRKIEVVSAKADASLTAIRGMADSVKAITAKLGDATEIVHHRIKELDAFLGEATRTARLEILQIQDTMQTASRRVGETLELIRNGILAPLNEINAITRAIRVGLDVLFRWRRNPSRTSAQDEEMFI